jgi:hypothetical protein
MMTKLGSKCFVGRLQERAGPVAQPRARHKLELGEDQAADASKVGGTSPIKEALRRAGAFADSDHAGSFDPPDGAVSVEKLTCDRFYLWRESRSEYD